MSQRAAHGDREPSIGPAPDRIQNKCCHLRAGPPYATSLPDQVKLRPGDSLSLQCLAHGSHPIQFEWSRVGRAGLPAGTETTRAGKLMIAQVKTGDSGTYKCVASNHIGTSEALAKVVIRGESIIVLLAVYKDHKMKPQPSDHWRAVAEIKNAYGYFYSMLIYFIYTNKTLFLTTVPLFSQTVKSHFPFFFAA